MRDAQRRLVAPLAVPLVPTPGVPELDQLEAVHFGHPDQRVGVARDQPVSPLGLALLGGDRGGEEGLSLVIRDQQPPQLLAGVRLRRHVQADLARVVVGGLRAHVEALPRRAHLVTREREDVVSGHHMQRPQRKAALEARVRPAQLRKGLGARCTGPASSEVPGGRGAGGRRGACPLVASVNAIRIPRPSRQADRSRVRGGGG